MRACLVPLLVLATACSSTGGSGHHGGGGEDLAGLDGGVQAADLATTGAPDLTGIATPPDLASPPVDLASPPFDFASPPVDLASPPVDLAVASGPCVPGHYVGPLMATASFGGLPIDLAGMADLMLAPAQNGVLAATGSMYGENASHTASASADVVGQLDCGTLQFTATLENGKATYSGVSVPFTGTASALYDPGARELVDGTLTTSGISGTGTWTATLQ